MPEELDLSDEEFDELRRFMESKAEEARNLAIADSQKMKDKALADLKRDADGEEL